MNSFRPMKICVCKSLRTIEIFSNYIFQSGNALWMISGNDKLACESPSNLDARKNTLYYAKFNRPMSFRILFAPNEPIYKRQVVNPQHQKLQGQLNTEHKIPLYIIPNQDCNFDTKWGHSNISNPFVKRKSFFHDDWLIEQLYFVISDKYNFDNKIYIHIDKIKV